LSISCGTYPCHNTYQIYNLNDLEPLPFWKKGKMKHKKKKWSYSHPIRDLNKAKILELLKENWSTGFTQKEIIKKTKLTKPTVISILKELKSEHRIHRLASIYFPEFDDDFAFAYFFADYVDHFLIKIMENKENTSNVVDTQHISKVVVKNSINKSIFEFVNMMGALITYILIESSSVYVEDREPAKIEELINNIFKGVIWKDIFINFKSYSKITTITSRQAVI
jgi:DNA-binding Lrp family transcriptional regulator